jgi:hypothetical protein
VQNAIAAARLDAEASNLLPRSRPRGETYPDGQPSLRYSEAAAGSGGQDSIGGSSWRPPDMDLARTSLVRLNVPVDSESVLV